MTPAFLVTHEQLGDHVHLRFFSARTPGAQWQHLGVLITGEAEWIQLRLLLELGAIKAGADYRLEIRERER